MKCFLQPFVNLDLASISRFCSSLLAHGYTTDFIDSCVPAQCVHITASRKHSEPSVPCGTYYLDKTSRPIKKKKKNGKTKRIQANGVMKFSRCLFFYLHYYFSLITKSNLSFLSVNTFIAPDDLSVQMFLRALLLSGSL